MKIAILGNGRMGKKISQLATERGHHIVCRADSKKIAKTMDLSIADVAIDFSIPDTAFDNISHAINNRIPIISGTTGWLDRIQEIKNLCIQKEGAFLYASNFSLGANLFFDLNKKLARLMKGHDYNSKIHEIHHTQKLDTPSGTAMCLMSEMEDILEESPTITSERINNTPGTHQITYSSEIDQIEIRHTANNRDGFAIGAIIASEWIIGKKGIFSIKDVFIK